MIARNRNELWGRVLMDELARSGIRHVIVSPGSRSAPVVLCAASDRRFRVTVQIDERSAGFLALGVGKATGVPAAVVTTSGTAVANLLPAVVEASQAEAPLILLTADRPPRLRGADANQTIEQPGIFGGYVRLFAELSTEEASERALRHLRAVVSRAAAAAIGSPPGPVHLNLPFAKPLEPTPVPGDLPPELEAGTTLGAAGRPDGQPWTRVLPARAAPLPEDVAHVAQALGRATSPVLVAGVVPRPWELGPRLRRVATELRIPVLADILSGARFPTAEGATGGAPVVGGYDLALGDSRVLRRLRSDLVIRVGAAPTSSNLGSWLQSLEGVPHIVIDGGGRWKDHAGLATRVVVADPGRFLEALVEKLSQGPASSSSALEEWVELGGEVGRHLEESLSSEPFEGSVAAAVARRADPDDIVFASSSMPVRDLDTFAPSRDRPLMVIGNRGASGIDGIVSTAAGASLGTGRRVVALIGDLALLHDSNGLSALREPGVRVLVVVVNNDGGGIFHLLPISDFEPAFTPLFVAPHGRDLSRLASFHGLPHLGVELRSEDTIAAAAAGAGQPERATDLMGATGLAEGLVEAFQWSGSGVIEVRTDRVENRRRREAAVGEISSSVGAALVRLYGRTGVQARSNEEAE